MSEDPSLLAAQAKRVVEVCETHLELAVEFVRDSPRRREEAKERLATAREREREAKKEYSRVVREGLGERYERAARREMSRASREVWKAGTRLAIGQFDSEYRKAVARQIAGLLREDSQQKLDVISERSDDTELQRTVSDCKDEVSTAAHYVLRRFAEARPLQGDEVRKARSEASGILDHLRNPPVNE